MLTHNLWADIGLHNGAKGKVVDFVYTDAAGPGRNNGKGLPEAVVVVFHELAYGVEQCSDSS